MAPLVEAHHCVPAGQQRSEGGDGLPGHASGIAAHWVKWTVQPARMFIQTMYV